jgi:putative hydrolase of the HAD superfamily
VQEPESLRALLAGTRAILFDMDDVLCRLDDEARIEYLHELCGMPHNDITYAIWGSGFEDRTDAGEFSAEDYLVEFGKRIDYPISLHEWCEYRKCGMTPYPEVLEFARGLMGSHKLGILTNNGLLLQQEIDTLFPELRLIFGNNIYCSAQFGCRKPSPEVFIKACQLLGFAPSETLFIDDLQVNVAGAVNAGLSGYVVKSMENFLIDLKNSS